MMFDCMPTHTHIHLGILLKKKKIKNEKKKKEIMLTLEMSHMHGERRKKYWKNNYYQRKCLFNHLINGVEELTNVCLSK